jgi:hypothetical protein
MRATITSRLGVAALSVAVLLALSSPALGANVSGTSIRAQHVTPHATATAQHRTVYPLRVLHPAQYAREKAAANHAYAHWAARHPFSTTFGPSLATIAALNKPGLSAAGEGAGNTPPDTTGAVNSSKYFEFVNSEVGVFSRTTLGLLNSVSEDTFTGSSNTCDGQIKWDQAAKRWLYYSLDCAQPKGSEGYNFGWSKTASPTPLPSSTSTGNWCRFHIATSSDFEDYGKLGQDNNFMIVGTNEFSDSTNAYLDSPIFAWPKPANGSTACPTSISGTRFVPNAGIDFTPEPANIFGSSGSGFVVGENRTSSTLKNLRMYKLTGTTTPKLADLGNIGVSAYKVPANVPQPGSSDMIDSLDGRLTQANAVVDPNLKALALWTQQTIAGSGGGPSVVRWYELEPGKTTPVQTGKVSVSGAFAFNGAISPTIHGNAAAIDYNVGGSSTLVTLRARVHPIGSAAGSMTSETTLATSGGIDDDFSCPSVTHSSRPCRWGDYAGASFDPSSGDSVWGSSQTQTAPLAGNFAQWKTNNFRLTVP